MSKKQKRRESQGRMQGRKKKQKGPRPQKGHQPRGHQPRGHQPRSHQPRSHQPRQKKKEGRSPIHQFPEHRVFSHLDTPITTVPNVELNSQVVHPAIIRLGYQYASHRIEGSNSRAVALLVALKEVIRDYKTPYDKVMRRHLVEVINPQIDHLNSCRAMSVSMRNALKQIKMYISKLPPNDPEDVNKKKIDDEIDTFIREKISVSMEPIAEVFTDRIHDGDVILTYGRSEVVEYILTKAFQSKKFSVIIVGARPGNEGTKMLKKLSTLGVRCDYVLINAVSHVMKRASYVLVGASSCFCNGNVLGRMGTAVVAMTAKNFNVPFLVCCQLYKFSEKTQLSSITFNELCNPSEVSKELSDKRNLNVKVINMFYDLTPIEFVDAIITEIGWLPPTSVPVILREAKKDLFK